MKSIVDYRCLVFVILFYFCMPIPAHGNKPTAERGLVQPSVNENVALNMVAPGSMEWGFNLVGTLVTHDPEMNFAVISNLSTGKQRAYREGDRIENKALIKKILRNRVIIEAGNGELMLVVGHPQPSGIPPASHGVARARTPENTRLYANIVRDQDLSVFLPASYDRKDVDTYFVNIEAWKKVHVKPAVEHSMAGFVITHIHPGSIPWRMGLRSGDGIKSINGKIISSTNDVNTFFSTLKKGGNITVEIEREKQIQVRQIAVPAVSVIHSK